MSSIWQNSRARPNVLAPALVTLAIFAAGCGSESSAPSTSESASPSKDDGQGEQDGKVAEKAPASFEETAAVTTALLSPSQIYFEHLGPHHFSARSKVVVGTEGNTVDTIENEVEFSINKKGEFYALLKNDKGYRHEVYFLDGLLYLRPAEGKFHKRLPTSLKEPQDIRNQLLSDLPGYFSLFSPSAEFYPAGTSTVSKRKVDSFTLKLSKKPAPQSDVDGPTQNWRKTLKVKKLSGSFDLDQKSKAPIKANFDGSAGYQNAGQDFSLAVQYRHTISKIGKANAIALPADAKFVSSPLEEGQLDTFTKARKLDQITKGKQGAQKPQKKPGKPAKN